jgi:hypothetical protein
MEAPGLRYKQEVAKTTPRRLQKQAVGHTPMYSLQGGFATDQPVIHRRPVLWKWNAALNWKGSENVSG